MSDQVPAIPDYDRYRAAIVTMACDEGLSNTQIGKKVGFPPSTIRMWLSRPDYKEAIREYYEILEEETFRLAAIHRANRLRKLQEVLDKMDIVMAERAKAYENVNIGGKSGLLVKQVKTVGSGPNAYDVAEYVYDSALVRDILSIHKQIAQEKGEWSERKEHNVTITEAVKVIRFETQRRVDDEPAGVLDSNNPIEADFNAN
jgi:replicative DNA helicase